MATAARKKRPDRALYFNALTAYPDTGSVSFFGHFLIYEGTDREVTRPMVLLKTGKWGGHPDIEGIVASACLYRDAKGNAVRAALVRTGLVDFKLKADRWQSTVPMDPGFLFSIASIGKHLYVCGSQNQVFRLEKDQWVPFDADIRVKRKRSGNPALLSIHGVSDRCIYAVGKNGSMLHFDGKAWRELDSPTDVDLNRVWCVSKTEVYVCGRGGAVFKGHLDQWTDLSDPGNEETFLDMVRYQDTMFLNTVLGVWKTGGGPIVPVPHTLGPDATFEQLAANELLWATSGKEPVYSFDGTTWKTWDCPENA